MGVRPQEVGKIKLGKRGAKKKSAGGADMFQPTRIDHFEIVTRERAGKDGAFVKDMAIHDIVGDKPTELEGTLGFHEIEDNLHTSMRLYAGRRAKIKCDGISQVNPEGKDSPCSKPEGMPCPNGCKPYCRLHLQLHASPHTGGYHVLRTRSWESTNNVQTFMEETFARFGTLFQAPVKLMAYQSEDQYESGGKEMTGKSTKVALVLNMPYEAALLHMVQAKERLEAMKSRLMITAGEFTRELDERDEEDEAEIADEFSPPKGVDASVGTQAGIDEVVDSLEPVEPGEAQETPTVAESGDGAVIGDIDNDSGTPYGVVTASEALEESMLKVEPQRNILIELRDEAREANLLDATAEQFIKDALDSWNPTEIDKATRALNRRFAQAEKRGD
jgi:hypothetical protein